MIIRLLRGEVPAPQEAGLIQRLRALDGSGGPPAGFGTATFGFRRAHGHLEFLALSTWESIDAIAAATAGSAQDPMPSQLPRPSLTRFSIDLFEATDGDGLDSPVEARTLGLIWARVIRHAEATAHNMIRATEAAINAAGVTSLHVGRRVVGDQEELLVVAGWRDRLALHAFAQGRSPGGPIDPTFLALLSEWQFSTYDCLTPGAAGLPEEGAAVLLTDANGTIVDASPAIEALLGVPGELVLGRALLSLRPHDASAPDSAAWTSILGDGADTELRLQVGRGAATAVRARSANDCPQAGFRAIVLNRPEQARDRRALSAIVAEAFGRDPAKRPAAGAGRGGLD